MYVPISLKSDLTNC